MRNILKGTLGRTLAVAAIAGVALTAVGATTAQAREWHNGYGWHNGWHGGWHEGWNRPYYNHGPYYNHAWYGGRYYAPQYYAAPPVAYPQPYYAPPGINLNIPLG